MKLHRPKLRFSLKAFLLIISLFAVWLSITVQRTKHQKTAVAKIESIDGSVRYGFEPNFHEFRRRLFERQKSMKAGKTPPEYSDGPNVPKWLVKCFGVDAFARVETVELSRTLCTNDDLQTILSRLPSLRSLSLSHVPNITSDGLAAISSTKIRSLTLDGNRYRNGSGEFGLDDGALAHLSDCKNLQSLSLQQNRFTDEGLKHISGLTQLRSLDLTSTDVTPLGLVHVANMKQLRSLSLPFLIDDEALHRMGGLVELKRIGRFHSSVTDKGLTSIRRLRNLTSISLQQTQVTDSGLKVLNSMMDLKSIDLNETSVTSEGIKQMGILPRLERLTLNKTKVDDECVEALSAMKTLRTLNVHQTSISNAGLDRLTSELPKTKVYPLPSNDIGNF